MRCENSKEKFPLFQFSNDGPNGESMCLQGPDCFMVSRYVCVITTIPVDFFFFLNCALQSASVSFTT